MRVLFSVFLFIFYVEFSTSDLCAASWEGAKSSKTATITVIYSEVKPFIYPINAQELAGIEYELMIDFKRFLKEEYGINIKFDWVKSQNLDQIYETIQREDQHLVLGLAGFSETEQRKKLYNTTPTYMPDISVIVMGSTQPVIMDSAALLNQLKSLPAITVKNTTFEEDILSLKQSFIKDLQVIYIPNGNLINEISQKSDAFGYVDLPLYLLALEEGYLIKRQQLFQVQRAGYTLLYQKNSSWSAPVNQYFNSIDFKLNLNKVIKKYLGNDVTELLKHVSSEDSLNTKKEIALLTKEKEIQSQQLINAALSAQRQRLVRNFLIFGSIFLLIIALFIYNRYKYKRRSNEALQKKNDEIEQQNKQIEQQKGELEVFNKELVKINEHVNEQNTIIEEQFQDLQQHKEQIEAQNDVLEGKNGELVSLNDEKNYLIGLLAHDLRSPVNQVKGLVQLMQLTAENLNEEQAEYLNKIIDSAERINTMIHRILDVEAIESKDLKLNLVKFNIILLLDKMADQYGKQASAKQIDIHRTYLEQEPVLVEIDENYTHQVFENLLSNAIKFSPSERAIHISIDIEENFIVCTIKDEGPGLTEEDQKKLFNKYQKLSAKPTAGESSTGLGLSIVKRFVEAMGGKIWCESEPGNGATFKVKLKRVNIN